MESKRTGRWAWYLVMGLFSAGILAGEIALTRIFSVIFWYHFGFLILSTSLLGFAVGGVLVRLFRERLKAWSLERVLLISLPLSGILCVISLFVITHNLFSPLMVHHSWESLFKLFLVSVALIPPYALMGGTVILLLQRWPGQTGPLYAANLAGSGIGCFLALVLMDLWGGLTAFLLVALLMPLAIFPLCREYSRRALMWVLGTALLVAMTLPFAEALFPLESPVDKFTSWLTRDRVVYSGWSSLSKLDICEESYLHSMGYGLWGLSPNNTAPLPERLGVVIDFWAYTTIIKDKPELGYYDFYDSLPMYIAYKMKRDPKTLIIGAGGGMDIRGALRGGARDIDAVEINPLIYQQMTGDLADYSGRIYLDPRVRAHLAEGRRFVESSDDRWDIIQLSGVDTYSATQAGAFALSENFLYTKEAVRSYLEHLSDDGIITMTRWYNPSKEGLPRFSLRLFTLMLESMREAGIENPEKKIFFFRSGFYTVILAKKKEFSAEDFGVLNLEIKKRGYNDIYRPDREVKEEPYYLSYVHASDREAWLDAYPFNVAPPTDDSPFYFEVRKLSTIANPQGFLMGYYNGLDGQTILVLLLFEMAVVSLVLLWLSRRLDKNASRFSGWFYFTAIGFGFMLVDVTMSQRLVLFLGHPARALSVVMFSVLLFSGLGALLHGRLRRTLDIRTVLIMLVAYLLAWAVFGGGLLHLMLGWPTALRILMAVLLIGPAAIMMGTALPEAVQRLLNSGETELGLYWAFNGVASVTASVIAVLVAMGSGFHMVMLLAAFSYALAALLLPRLGRP